MGSSASDVKPINLCSLLECRWLLVSALTIFLVIVSSHNYLLFHTLAEMFAIMVAILAAVVIWQTYHLSHNHYFMYLGGGYLWIAILDIAHVLTYKGMSIFPGMVANIPTQFWISARYFEAFLLFSAPYFLTKQINRNVLVALFGTATVILYAFIMSGSFPDAFIEGEGLTQFKVISEYVIIIILAFAMLLLWRRRQLMDRRILSLMMISIILTMCAEMAFTFYVDVYGLFNLLGHIFKLLSCWLIYEAIVLTTLKEPIRVLNKNILTEMEERKQAETALRSSQKMLQLVLDSIPVRVFWKDTQSVYLGCNRLFAKDAGLESPSQIVGKTDFELAWQEQANLYRSDDQHVIQSEQSKLNYEEPQTGAEGESWVRTSKIPLTDLSGTVIGVMGTYEDITERKKSERELLEAKVEAERANHAKTEFLSRMSHELRTPLNAILGFGELLQLNDGNLNETQRDCASYIMAGGTHLLALINEVLDISQVDAGDIKLSIEAVSLGDTLDETLMLIKPLAAKEEVTIEVAAGDAPWVHADAIRVKQVLVNLLSNAVKYNRKGGTIAVNFSEGSEKRVRINVVDTGIGIREEDQAELFEPFHRIEAKSNKIEGKGIGLAITKKLVEAMGGEIGVTSIYAQGSTFWFELPREEAIEKKRVDSALFASDMSGESIAGVKALYVEDNPANLRMIQLAFKQQPDCELLTATNAEQGIVLAEQERPDLILMDIGLPEMDGFEALKVLHSNSKTAHIPVIALSAYAMKEQVDKGSKAGFAGYLTKPVEIDVLMNAIKSVLTKNKQ